VTDAHTTPRRSRTRFNSWRGHGAPGEGRSTQGAGS
jgi:hypothetical protein